MHTITTETKPGILTTEFFVTLFTNVISLLNLTGAWNYVPNKYTVILMAIVNAAYAVARGQAKQGVPFQAMVDDSKLK